MNNNIVFMNDSSLWAGVKCLVAASLMFGVSTFEAQAFETDEPIITFHTTLYDDNGADNTFGIVLGATEAGVQYAIDCGYGKQYITVDRAEIDSTGELGGTYFSCSVSSRGTVKIYGDPTKIDYFHGGGCYITDIDMHPDMPLQILNLEHNSLGKLSLDNFTDLSVLYLMDNPFDVEPFNITVPMEQMLVLEVGQIDNIAPNFNLANFPALVSFDAYHTVGLAQVDPSQCPDLVRLSLDMTSVAQVDVTNNPKLRVLNVSDSRVCQLDLSQNPELSELYVTHSSGSLNTDCKFSSIDLSHSPKLLHLFCGGNNLTEIDLSHNPQLFTFSAPYNNLTSVSFDNNPDLYSINLTDNRMNFATLPWVLDSYGEYYYSQKEIVLDDYYKVGDVIDLSDKVLRLGTTTTVKFMEVPKDEPTSRIALDKSYYDYDKGKVTFKKETSGKTVCLIFYNSHFTEYPLSTEWFTVVSPEQYGKDQDAVSIATSVAEGTDIAMTIGIKGASASHPVDVKVTFGNDDQPQTFTIDSEVPQDINITGKRNGSGNIKVWVPQGEYVTAIEMDGIPVGNIDLTELTDLRVLSLTNAQLYNIDLRYNGRLEKLNLSGNPTLASLDLRGPSNYFYKGRLSWIDLSGNGMSEFVFDDLYAIKHLNLKGNRFTDLEVKNADRLTWVDLSDNLFTTLLFSHSEDVEYCDLSNNNLSYIYLAGGKKLQYYNVSGNLFTFLDLPERFDLSEEQFVYAPQQPVQIAKTGPGADLSYLYFAENGFDTQYVWKTVGGETLQPSVDYTITKGKTKFINMTVGEVYCEISHGAYPQFADQKVLCTTAIKPIEVPSYEIANFYTTDMNEVLLSLAAAEAGTSLYIDWKGNGDMTQYLLGTTYTMFDAQCYPDTRVRVYVADPSDEISIFSITGAKMSEFNGFGLDKAFAITVEDADLTSINLPQNNSLFELKLGGNKLTEIDLSLYPNLYFMSLNSNKFTTLDLSAAHNLGWAYLGNNLLTEVHFDNPDLVSLDLGCNNFEEVSFEGAPNIEQLWVFSNNLHSIDLDGLSRLRVINLVDNYFTFASLPSPLPQWNVFYYGNQNDLVITPNGMTVDLSNEAVVSDVASVFRWFIGKPTIDDETGDFVGNELQEGTDFTLVNGVTTFLGERTRNNIVGVITNDGYPNLTLYTKPFSVTPTSGLTELEADSAATICYDLYGRRVENPKRGINVVDGKTLYMK